MILETLVAKNVCIYLEFIFKKYHNYLYIFIKTFTICFILLFILLHIYILTIILIIRI